eukprot:gene11832-2365_t
MAGLQSSDFVVGEDLDVLFDFCDDEWLDGDIEIQQQLICIGEEVLDKDIQETHQLNEGKAFTKREIDALEQNICKKSINAKQIVEAIMMDPLVKSNLAFLASSSELSVDKEVAKNLFEHVIHLFIRVRSHSLAKEIKEKHKERKISTKKRPLRTEIKQASLSKDLGH